MDRSENTIPDQLLSNLFDRTYGELDEQSRREADAYMDAKEFDDCHRSVDLLRTARLDLRNSASVKVKLMQKFEQRKSDKIKRKRMLFMKVAAVVVLIMANAVLINYYLGANSVVSPAVSGSDSGKQSKQLDTFRFKQKDTITRDKRDTILAGIPGVHFEFGDLSRLVLNSIICYREQRNRDQYDIACKAESQYSI